MPFKIVRQDITKMNTDAVVNTANRKVRVGSGCDTAIYEAAGKEELLAYRREHIGEVPEGEAFITPGFHLAARYIIHTVSPLYVNGDAGEEEKLRDCYRNSLKVAVDNDIQTIAFPLIATGSFGYPKEEGMRIAIDEMNAFLLQHEMMIYLVVFDERSTNLGEKLYPDLEAYIDQHYVADQAVKEYANPYFPQTNQLEGMNRVTLDSDQKRESAPMPRASYEEREQVPMSRVSYVEQMPAPMLMALQEDRMPAPMSVFAGDTEESDSEKKAKKTEKKLFGSIFKKKEASKEAHQPREKQEIEAQPKFCESQEPAEEAYPLEFEGEHEQKLQERLSHRSDTFSQYLKYLIQQKGLENADVWKSAIVDKKTFSKINTHDDYHPQKITALCLCVGARLNLDETKDLLARAGYALSPCDQTDIIFSYFIENKIYNMIDLDIQLEEHGLPCIIK